MMTDRKLAGQTVWISGGASGIGEATAELFAEEGASVAVVDVQTVAGRDVVERIAKSGGTAVFFECDVARSSQVRKSIDGAAELFGGLQIMVNCAGMADIGLLHEYPEEEWDRLMGVNLKSIYLSVKHGWPTCARTSAHT